MDNTKVLAINGGDIYRKKSFPLWPIYEEKEIMYLKEVLDSHNWWRVTGEKVTEFEKKFAEFQGSNYCLGVTNGTSALELALSVLGIGIGDEVIIPAMTFISTGLSVINCNATPVLVDIDQETLCMKVDQFEKAITGKTKAVIPVHMAGNGCNIKEICKIAAMHNIKVIEDAAHGHGGEIDNQRLGSFGDMAIFSFQNGKLMTCGEGGAILFKNKEMYEKAYLLQDVGRPRGDKKYSHLVRGSNYRMNEFQAAILLAQMERVNRYNYKREKNAILLDQMLNEVQGIKPQVRSKNTNIFTHYMYMFYYDKKLFGDISRNNFVECLNREGIPSNVCFPVLSEAEFFKNKEFNGRIINWEKATKYKLPYSQKAADCVVWLHHRVLEGNSEDVEDIVGAIKKIQNYFVGG